MSKKSFHPQHFYITSIDCSNEKIKYTQRRFKELLMGRKLLRLWTLDDVFASGGCSMPPPDDRYSALITSRPFQTLPLSVCSL
jgi:hypothetical protein